MMRGLLAIALLVLLQGIATLQGPAGSPEYTGGILRMAKSAQIRAYLDESVNKCDNFYGFACGQWKRLRPASAAQPKTSYLDQLQELFIRKSKDLLDGDLSQDVQMRKGDEQDDRMMKNFYESCRNSDAIKRIGIRPILDVVNFHRGGWPRVHNEIWYNYEYDWLPVIAELRRKLGVDILVGLEVVPDFVDKDMHRIKVGAPKLALRTKSAYLSEDNDELRQQYKQSIADKLLHYFPEMSAEWATSVAQQVLVMEQRLARGLPDNEKLSLKQTTRQRNAAELKAAYGSYVDLSRYMNLIFNQTIYVQVYETPEDYMSNLVDVIRETPKLTLANYTMWRVLERFDDGGDSAWCIRKVMEYFPRQLESLFYRNNNNNMHMVNDLHTVFNDIRREFRNELTDTSQPQHWLRGESRERAVQKLNNMELQIVRHHEDEDKRSGYLILHSDRYYRNMISIFEWRTAQQLGQLVEKHRAAEVEVRLPKYELTTNKILVPITFMQSRFFWDAAYPAALKYSTLGFFVAQQMLHGFDAVGRMYDHHGYQRHWSDAEADRAFSARSQCFQKQYSEAKFRGRPVKDPNPSATGIVDSGGLGIAYRTYQNWLDNQSLDNETLPQLSFASGQLFYLGFAQLWCSDYDESLERIVQLPEELRVNYALANLDSFAKEMSCEADSQMNRSEKCELY